MTFETQRSKITLLAEVDDSAKQILTPEACSFLVTLHNAFERRRRELIQLRATRQQRWDAGEKPDFLPETRAVRDDPHWRGAAPAPGLADRRVEITGPPDRKMVINAMNADVRCYMADFEGMLRKNIGGCFVSGANFCCRLISTHLEESD